MRKRQIFYAAVAFVVSGATAVFGINLIHAQETENQITLAVSPQSLDLTANPGEKLTNTFRLTNASNEAVEIAVATKNFVPRGEEGAVDLTTDTTGFSLAEWMEVQPQTVNLGAGKTEDFKVDISVPDEAEPGSHFGSVVFSTVPQEREGTAAAVSQEIAPVILVRVAGEVEESARIVDFKADKSFYSNEDSVTLTSRIENTGSVHFKPAGKIEIKNMFGKKVTEIELDKRNVLPGSVRQIPTTWDSSGFKIGRYKATLTLVLGDGNIIETDETTITFFPYQVIVPVILVIALVVFGIVRYRQRIKLALRVLRGKDNS